MSSTMNKLKSFNIIMAVFHAAQAIAILYLSKDFLLPVTSSYLQYDTASQSLVQATATLFHVNIAYLVVKFLILSAIAHLVIGTIYNKQYNTDLAKGMNRARWVEYALSASVMMVAIAMLVGVYDLGSLIMMFALVVVMNLLGYAMEVHNQTTKTTSWLTYNIGSLAGIIPWIVVALYFWASNHFGTGEIPTFVYWIYVSIFIFFSCFAINMILQYKKIGPWKDYLYGERVYIILSLVAKSALAWQVFAGTLRP